MYFPKEKEVEEARNYIMQEAKSEKMDDTMMVESWLIVMIDTFRISMGQGDTAKGFSLMATFSFTFLQFLNALQEKNLLNQFLKKIETFENDPKWTLAFSVLEFTDESFELVKRFKQLKFLFHSNSSSIN